MARMLTGVHKSLEVLKNLEVSGRVSTTDGKVLRWSKSVLLATATSSERGTNGQNYDLPSYQNSLSKCRGVLWSLWSVVER